MNTSSLYRRIPSLLIGCTLFANCLFLWGCPLQPRYPGYPAVLVTPEKDGELALSLDTAAKSDNPLMMDLSALAKKGKLWRVQVFKVYDGKLQSSTDWKSVSSERKAILTGLPMNVVLRGDIEVCPSDDPKAPDVEHEGRSILFLLHKYPD
jgi:hypothetical protein